MTEADGKPHASTGHARAITGAPPVEHRRAHQGRFHSPHRFSEARVRRKGPGAHGTGAMAGVVTGDRSRDRRRELAGDATVQEGASRDRRRETIAQGKAQVGTGRKGTAVQEDASGDRQEGTTVQEGASGEMQEGDDGAGRRKRGQAGRERWRGARSGRTRKEAD